MIYAWFVQHHHNCYVQGVGGVVKAKSEFEAFIKAYEALNGCEPSKQAQELAKKDNCRGDKSEESGLPTHMRDCITYGVDTLCDCKCQPISIKKIHKLYRPALIGKAHAKIAKMKDDELFIFVHD